MLQKAFGFFFIFIWAPFGTGLLWSVGMGKERHKISNIYLTGFLTELAVFQLLAVPIMIREPFGMVSLVKWNNLLLALLSVAGIAAAVYHWQKSCRQRSIGVGMALKGECSHIWGRVKALLIDMSWECRIFWLLAVLAVGFQMYMSFAYAVFDGDDAYYVVQSVIADQTDVLNRIRPYTGLSTNLDIRHALATLPLWEAYVARMTGIHAAIVAHTLLPLVLIPLTYLCYFLIGRKLLEKNALEKGIAPVADSRLPIFMILVSVMQVWGNTSIYTNATFFLMRTWQGKSIMANLVLLVLIWLLLEIFEESKEAHWSYWLLLIVTNIVAAMMTSMGAFLAAMFIGIVGVVGAVVQKRFKVLWELALCCIPNVFYLLLLFVIG